MSLIAQSDRIPFPQKIAFAAGVNMDYVATSFMINTLWMPVFNIGLGMEPLVLGIILMTLRAWDAITDPIMGNISDNARTRWGRRRPFIFVGALATACMYPLLWHIPDFFGDTGRAIYLTVVGLAFFTCFTFWSMPYYGLQLELTPNYDERTRLAAWMALFGKLSTLAGGWLLSIVILLGTVAANTPDALANRGPLATRILSTIQPLLVRISNPDTDEKPIVIGMRITCWLIALCILYFGLLPALFVKERYYKPEAAAQARDPFWQSIRESARCSPLRALICISFFLVLGTTSIASLGQYVNFYYACQGDLALGAAILGWKATITVTAGIAAIPFFTWLGERFDKCTVVMVMLGTSMTGHLLNWFLMTPTNPYLQIIPGVFESCAISAIWIFLPSMKADVADYDELHTTRRREGSINSFYSWFIKVAFTASMGIGGLVLQLSGFNARLDAQPADVVQRMFVVYLILPLVIWSIAMTAACFYPLTRARSAVIRNALENRRGAL
ncbi:sodium:melibiose symporter [Opitutaceae bacterium TAV4]|nr:sodium:melibiose symporter [Opitutaceae bacterium TAV4]RRK02818.1 sodium:melibiose symporter [Opitutaceae bacterium TAV3]